MYPPIIDKEMFERVQQRLASNRYFLGGKETAKEPYLLTGKLFCGHCGAEMVAGGGKSKTGKKYYYYECKQKKKKLCTKRIEHKDKLEKFVVRKVIDFLSDEVNLNIVTQDVLKHFNSRTDEREIKSIRKRIADIQEEADAAANAFIEAKNPLLKQRIEKRMQECEVLLADLEKVKARLVIERGQKLTEQDIKAFVNMILQGDVEDLEFKRRLIDNLVYKVYVSDGDTYIYFNIKGGNHIEEITLEDTKAALKKAKRVQTQRDPARQSKSELNRCSIRIFCWNYQVYVSVEMYRKTIHIEWNTHPTAPNGTVGNYTILKPRMTSSTSLSSLTTVWDYTISSNKFFSNHRFFGITRCVIQTCASGFV